MHDHPTPRHIPVAQHLAERAFLALERFLHIEAVSGIVLLLAAAAALTWANSPIADSYHALWHTPVTLAVGPYAVSRSLHFWINDGLMTVFFLVIGMEIRREMHEGALANPSLAALPLAAATGGVVVPALIYLALNGEAPQRDGWAVPTATDIAFAVGVLALLGRSIPPNVRVLLLALAVIDDLAAVLIIAAFYSGGLETLGFAVAAAGILLAIGQQRIGIGSAWMYVVPGAIVWLGLLQTGAHPALAGVVLGLITPVRSKPLRASALDTAGRAVGELSALSSSATGRSDNLMQWLRELRTAQRELLPPVVRVQMALHPWVAFGVMPLFALANAGVTVDGIDVSEGASRTILLGVIAALVLGKPLGIVGAAWLAVRVGWSRLPADVAWSGIGLVGLLAGIGFTMSIFIANLAFAQPQWLGAAKLGVLIASLVSAVLGLFWGALRFGGLRSPSAMKGRD